MLVEGQLLHAQLHIQQPAAAELQSRSPGSVEGGARFPEAAVGAQLVRVLAGNRLERLGADLLLAFDEEAQRDRDLAEALQRLECLDSSHDVRLVVRDSAGDDATV